MDVIDFLCDTFEPKSATLTIEFVGGAFFEFRRETEFHLTKRLLAESRDFASTIYKGSDKEGNPVYGCPAAFLDIMVPDADVIAQARILEQQCLRAWVVEDGEEVESEKPSVWQFLKLAKRQGGLFGGLVNKYIAGQQSTVIQAELERMRDIKKNSSPTTSPETSSS